LLLKVGFDVTPLHSLTLQQLAPTSVTLAIGVRNWHGVCTDPTDYASDADEDQV
jgi:hypothetical protein